MDVEAFADGMDEDYLTLGYGPDILNMANILRLTVVRFNRYESFQKATGRNRMLIGSSRGPTLLSIPILGGRSHHQLYGQTRIDHRQPWKRQHLGALRSNYGKSAYWEHYRDAITELYDAEISLLFDWNLHILQFLVRLLCPDTSIIVPEHTERSGRITLTHNLKHLPDPELPAYHQVFEQKTGFLNNLSVIDLLLNVGHPRARLYLENLSLSI
jgi:hypothetical protein